jgi:hypothetical protein
MGIGGQTAHKDVSAAVTHGGSSYGDSQDVAPANEQCFRRRLRFRLWELDLHEVEGDIGQLAYLTGVM